MNQVTSVGLAKRKADTISVVSSLRTLEFRPKDAGDVDVLLRGLTQMWQDAGGKLPKAAQSVIR